MATTQRPLAVSDLDAIVALAAARREATGGSPLADDRQWLSDQFLGNVTASVGVFLTGGALAAAGSVEAGEQGAKWRAALIVHPTAPESVVARAGRWMSDSLAGLATPATVLVRSESLTDDEIRFWSRLGAVLEFEEIVMSCDVTGMRPEPRWPADVTLLGWSAVNAHQFYEAYNGAFAERPGFPGWSEPAWVSWMAGGDDFEASASVCALVESEPAAFVVCDRAWISQVGVVPSRRHVGLGRLLVEEAVRRLQAAGAMEVGLMVNTNNPDARRLYEGLGFRQVGRRGRLVLHRE
jgi:ribosomal protein S18 acetylase RimI-like enzyme